EGNGKLLLHFSLGVYSANPGKMQGGIQQHGRMTRRQNEAVAIRPQRISRVIFEKILPKRIHYWRQTHRSPGVARICLLHGVDRERADGIDTKLVDVWLAHGNSGAGVGGTRKLEARD